MNDQELQLAELLEQLAETIAQINDAMDDAKAAFVEILEGIITFINANLPAAFLSMADAICDLSYDVQPKKKHPRPPRYAGPKNKGRLWTMAPQRVARSNCRRYRR